MKKDVGAATLILTVILLVAAVLMLIFSSNHSKLLQKTSTNQYNNSQASQAAEAGFQYALAYISKNYSTIVAAPSGGLISYTIASTTLSNNASYSVVITNPTANNFDLLKIVSTGRSPDNTATRVVQGLVYPSSILIHPPSLPVTSKNQATIGGSSQVINMQNNSTVSSGGSVSFSGSGSTLTSSGGSDKNSIGSDVNQNVSSLTNATTDTFFNSYFGSSASTVQGEVSNFFSSASKSDLDGLTGASIWVDSNLSLNGNVTIGSATAPVILIVNGDLSINGNLTFYGFIYATGNLSISGSADLTGGAVTAGQLSMTGNGALTYNSTTLNTSGKYSSFSLVPGSWKDF